MKSSGQERPDQNSKEDVHELNQGRPVRSVRRLTGAPGDERSKRAARHRNLWDFDPVMHAYATDPDLDRLIARAHGDPARPEDNLR